MDGQNCRATYERNVSGTMVKYSLAVIILHYINCIYLIKNIVKYYYNYYLILISAVKTINCN